MPQMINYDGELIRISPKDSKKLEYSKNNGLSWNQRCTGSSSYGKFIDLIDNGKELLATTEKGLYFSTNKELSWNVRKRNSDVRELMDGAENAIILSGKATGSNRCGDAIEDAVLHTCSIACGYDLFSANKVIIFIVCPKDDPMLMSENEAIITFIQMFHQNVSCKWGLAEKSNIHEMRIMIIASNLQKK